MYWARHIEIEDLLEDDLRIIYDECGEDVLLSLLDTLKGMNLYLKEEPVREMARRYIREEGQRLSDRELAARLDVPKSFVEEVRANRPETT